MTTNAERCALASAAVASYRHAGGGDPDDLRASLGDLLSDVLHLIYEQAGEGDEDAQAETEHLHAISWRNFTAELHEARREAADVEAMDAERSMAGASGAVAGEPPAGVADRLEYLRGELRAERISYGEVAELQDLGSRGLIPADDLELREAAGLPEVDLVGADLAPLMRRNGVQAEDVQDALAHLGVQLESAEQYGEVASRLRGEWLEPFSFDTMGEDDLRQLCKEMYAALSVPQLRALQAIRSAS